MSTPKKDVNMKQRHKKKKSSQRGSETPTASSTSLESDKSTHDELTSSAYIENKETEPRPNVEGQSPVQKSIPEGEQTSTSTSIQDTSKKNSNIIKELSLNLSSNSQLNEDLISNLSSLRVNESHNKSVSKVSESLLEVSKVTDESTSTNVNIINSPSLFSKTDPAVKKHHTEKISEKEMKSIHKSKNKETLIHKEKITSPKKSETKDIRISKEISLSNSEKYRSKNIRHLSSTDAIPNTINKSNENVKELSSTVSTDNQSSVLEKSMTRAHLKVSVGTQSEIEVVQSKACSSKCLRHSATVIAEDTSVPVISGVPDLCINCSKSMLSYIVLIQKFLDGLAQGISRQVDPLTQCFECVKENLDIPPTTHNICEKHISSAVESKSSRKHRKTSTSSRHTTDNRKSEVSHNSENNLAQSAISKESSEYFEHSKRVQQVNQNTYNNQINVESHKIQNKGNFTFNEITNVNKNQSHTHISHQSPQSEVLANKNTSIQHEQISSSRREIQHFDKKSEMQYNQQSSHVNHETQNYNKQNLHHVQNNSNSFPVNNNENQSSNGSSHQSQSALSQNENILTSDHFTGQSLPEYVHGEGVDGIMSSLYDLERGERGLSKDSDIWQQVSDGNIQTNIRVNNEAFVTVIRSNTEALGSIVLAASLLLSNTNRNLCVVVSDNVTADFMPILSSLFHDVIHTRSLDSVGNTKLALLEQPEFGISYPKLNVWRLKQFTKCVYMNPDTLVVQNCDELFCYEELSAVPDIGWPDCFNSGVFVFKPSDETFLEILEFADTQGGFNSGEQGLLNGFFGNWSYDIHKKLSFIYNLMANVSYTYTPAFKQFGRNVKIVQFLGSMKPWHVKFFSSNGHIAQSSTVHPTYVQFVHVWLNIFRIGVLNLFSPEIHNFAFSQESLCAHDLLLRFFPSPIGSDKDFLLLSPPSVRISPQQNLLQMSSAVEKLKLPNIQTASTSSPEENIEKSPDVLFEESAEDEEPVISDIEASNEEREGVENLPKRKESIKRKPKSLIPGSEVDDFQGMTAWEQGRMDYEGEASSETIMQRLSYLIKKSDRLV